MITNYDHGDLGSPPLQSAGRGGVQKTPVVLISVDVCLLISRVFSPICCFGDFFFAGVGCKSGLVPFGCRVVKMEVQRPYFGGGMRLSHLVEMAQGIPPPPGIFFLI